MSGQLLSDAERRRFCEYLENEVTTTRGLVTQMKLINVPAAVVKGYEIQAAACSVLLHMLAGAESQTITVPP